MTEAAIESSTRLLIVDDNRSIHDDFRKILVPATTPTKLDEVAAALFEAGPSATRSSAMTFNVDSAYQGEEACGLVADAVNSGHRYAMAFVDVRMPPGWDGVKTTARIWEMDPDLQVVICTAYSDCSWSETLDTLGRSDRLVILKKPFENVEVEQLANSLARKWHLLQKTKHKVAVLEDTVDRRTAQFVQEQAKFKAVFESSPVGIFQTTGEGRILTVNSSLAKIYGYSSPKEMLNRVANIRHQVNMNRRRPGKSERIPESDPIVGSFESEIKCKDGSTKWISGTACKVMTTDGTLLHYQGFVMDITAQKLVEREREFMEAQIGQTHKSEGESRVSPGIDPEMNPSANT